MATCIVMPKAGVSVETCVMGEWAKHVGDKVNIGDLVFTYETDKSCFEYRSTEDGYLLAALVSEGDDVPVMQPVCYIGAKDEQIDTSAEKGVSTHSAAAENVSVEQQSAVSAPVNNVELPKSVRTIVMPKAGVSVETCIMGEWAKKPGERVTKGDLVFTYETDKSCFEYRAEEDFVLLKTLVSEGDDVPVLAPVCYAGDGTEDASKLTAAQSAVDLAASADSRASQCETAASRIPCSTVVNRSGESLRISPRARKIAEKLDVKDYEAIPGTGPNGRIIERDIRIFAKSAENAAKAAAAATMKDTDAVVVEKKEKQMAAAGYTDKKLSNIRKVIAKNMFTSLSTMAQLTHSTSFDASEIIAYRKMVKAMQESMGLPSISLNDVLLFAVSRVLLEHKDLNTHFLGDSMRYFDHIHLGIAVDTPRGLLVPTIFNADTKSLAEIAAEARKLANECRDGSIAPENLCGASFTVSNVGMFGIESFTPVINPPQTGILGVCAIKDRVRMGENGIEVYPAMGLSLTYDHRAIDGAPASRFLQDMCKYLENFPALLAR